MENFEKSRWLYVFYFYYCNWGLKFQFIPVVFLKVFFIKMRKIIGLVVLALSVSLINSVSVDASPYSLYSRTKLNYRSNSRISFTSSYCDDYRHSKSQNGTTEKTSCLRCIGLTLIVAKFSMYVELIKMVWILMGLCMTNTDFDVCGFHTGGTYHDRSWRDVNWYLNNGNYT